jgi:hypothetical protein
MPIKYILSAAAHVAIPALLGTAPALAEAAAAAPAQAKYSTSATTIGELLDNAAAKAVIDKHLPGFSGNSQIEMARGMTLSQIQPFASDVVTDAALAKIDADLATVK